MSIKLRERKLAKGVKSYYLDIHENGVRRYEFLDIKTSPSDSKELRNEKMDIINLLVANKTSEIITQGTNYLPNHFKKVNFIDFANNFALNYKKKDKRMIESTIKKFIDFHKSNYLKIVNLTPLVLFGFKDYLNNEAGLTGETPQNYFTRFKKIIRQAELEGIIRDNPSKNIKFQKKISDDTLKKQVLTSEELQKLANSYCGNEEVKKAFLFACFTGLGFAELMALKWKHIIDDRLVTSREKTEQKVDLKLKPSLISLIGEKGNKQESIFKLNNISTNAVNKCIKNWTKRAEIEKHITFYCARHTFGTLLLKNGANLKTVSDAMAHTSSRSTIKYLNYIDSLKDNAIDNLPDITL